MTHDPQANDLVTRAIGLKSFDEEKRTVEFVASTDDIDSYGDVVDQKTWDLRRFKSNPVILFAHNSRELPIGKATKVGVVNGQLECTIQLLTAEANPLAEQVFQCIKAGALRAMSVGFYPNDVRLEKRNGREVYVLSNCELWESSVCPIPANPNALAKMKAKAAELARGQTTEENDMSDDLKARCEAAEKSLTTATGELAEARVKLAAVETIRATLKAGKDEDVVTAAARVVKERDEAVQATKAADLKLLGSELDALIGKKMTPAEKEPLLELAALSRDLFNKTVMTIKSRPDMTLLAAPLPVAKDAPAPTTGIDADNGAELDAAIQKDLSAA